MNLTIILNTILENIIFFILPKVNRTGFDLGVHTKTIKRDTSYPFKSVQLTTSQNNKKYIAKSINFIFKNLYVIQLLNEQKFLSVIAKIQKKQNDNNNHVLIQKKGLVGRSITTFQSFVNGRELSKFNQEAILKNFDQAFEKLNWYWKQLDYKTKNELPKVSPQSQFYTLPLYSLLALIKDSTLAIKILKLSIVFYKISKVKINKSEDLTIAHRDLTPENILVEDNGKTHIIDFEVSRVANKFTDLALFPRYFIDYLPEEKILEYIFSKLKTKTDKSQFMKLTIFYTIQFLFIENKGSKYYKESVKYIELIINKIIPKLFVEETTLAEKLYYKTLDFLGQTSMAKKTKGSAILCYHSVDDSNWRFSTPTSDFKKQLKYLKTNFKVVSLKDILLNSDDSNQVSITFDDGYEDVVKNAYPIMKNLGIVGAVFIVGNPQKSNKVVLGNDKKMLSNIQISKLLKSGWTIGYHTKTHSSLRNISEKRTSEEIKSKYKYFAYPNGYYDNKIISQLDKNKYKYAFTIDGGRLKTHNSKTVNRIPMEGKITERQFKTLMSNVGMAYSKIFMALLKLKEFGLKPYYSQ